MRPFVGMLVMAISIVCLAASAGAQVQTISGDWTELRLTEGHTDDPMCQYLDVEQLHYTLIPGPNRTVKGSLVRQISRTWLSPKPTCVLPGLHENPGYFLRWDTWTIWGEQTSENTLELNAVFIEFKGDAVDSDPHDFETELRRTGSRIYEVSKDPEGLIRLVTLTSQREKEEASASEAFLPLIKPLLKGNCNEFYAISLHSDTRFEIPVDQACSIFRPLADIFKGMIYDQPVEVWRLSLGTIQNGSSLRLLPDGDVIVVRSLILNSDGGNVRVAVVLRRDKNDDWKIIRFL